jgi:hypothetical protein
MEVATGITPHEHRGIGTPRIDAFKIDIKPGFPTLLTIISLEVKIYNNPDIKKPIIR